MTKVRRSRLAVAPRSLAVAGSGHRATGPAQRRIAPTVLVVGGPTAARSLARELPDGWQVRRTDAATTPADADLIVLYGAAGPTVAAARRLHPGAPVLAVIASHEPVDMIVEVLEAGADACVRETSASVITGHLLACQRRRTAA